jgi:hypothetical protein
LSSSAAETRDSDKCRVGRGVEAFGLSLVGEAMVEKFATQKWQDLLNLWIGQDFEECCVRMHAYYVRLNSIHFNTFGQLIHSCGIGVSLSRLAKYPKC